jgi:hypothetical protein
LWDQIPDTNQLSCFYILFHVSLYNFFSLLKTFLLLTIVAMLSLYQFSVKCRSGKVRGQRCAHRELLMCLLLSRHGIYGATWKIGGLAFLRTKRWLNSKKNASWKIILEAMIDNIFISEVDRLYICHYKQGRKTCTLRGISWYNKMADAVAEVSYNWGRYNQVQLYIHHSVVLQFM